VPTEGHPDHPDPDLAHAADIVRRTLVRFHPSFAFADRLAARLAATAAAGDAAPVAATRGELVILPAPPATQPVAGDSRGRLLLSGAIASGVSIAGAAFLAWRRSRPSASAMGRAARAIYSSRAVGLRPARSRIRREWLS
jgi:hypothetical protein